VFRRSLIITMALAAGFILAGGFLSKGNGPDRAHAQGYHDPSTDIILDPNPTPFFSSRRSRQRSNTRGNDQVNFPTAVAPTTPSKPPPPPPEATEDARPPYEEELVRLAEILGSVHYLRELCNADEGSLWRDQMNALLQAEEPQPKWRAYLVQNFNNGYRGFQRTYRECTPAAMVATRRYMAEGAELTQNMRTRYAN